MTATDLSAVTAALTDLVGSDLQAITFKWVARHFNIPYDTSKKVLFEFLSKQGQKVQAYFLLSGWTKDDVPRHVVRIVEGNSLDEAKAALGVITALHVYSVQPSELKDGDKLQNTDYSQSEEMFRKMLASATDQNPLSANLLSTVRHPAAKRDASLVRIVRKVKPAAEPSKPALKPAVPAAAPKPLKAPSPAKKAPAKPKETAKVKKAAEDIKKKASAPAAKPAEPKTKKPLIVDESDDDDEDMPAAKPPAAKSKGGAAAKSKRATLDDSDSDEEMPDAKVEEEKVEKKKATAAGDKKKAGGNKRKNAAQQEEEVVAKEEAKLPSPKFGTVKVHTEAPAGKRTRRVMKTFYNDSGEEVTEMVEETDDEAPSPAAAAAPAGTPAPAAAAAATASKPAPASAKLSTGGAGGTKKASGKGVPAGQRNIASFFGKK